MTKRIWIGLDVHAATIEVARLDGDSAVVQRASLENVPKLVERHAAQWLTAGEVVACYEAGACGYELYRQLTKLGVECIVVAPSLIPRKPGDRIKTDRRDAEKLVRNLRAGELTKVQVPTEEQEAVRDLVRAREDAREHRTAARNQLSKFLLRHGHRFTLGVTWTTRYWRWAAGLKFEHASAQRAFEHYVEQAKYLDGRVKLLDAEIAELAATEAYRERVTRLSCLRGVSTFTAMVVLTELFDLKRFANARQLMAYLGLVPSEHSSGGSVRRGGITKTGNSHVRRVLVEAAWHYRGRSSISRRQREALEGQDAEVATIASKATVRLSKRFARIVGRGRRPQVAVTAVARELSGFMWALENLAA